MTRPRSALVGLFPVLLLLGPTAAPAVAGVRACTVRVAAPCHVHAARHLRYARARYPRRPYIGYAPVIPPYDPIESWAEVHQVYPYRTPYPYPALFGPF